MEKESGLYQRSKAQRLYVLYCALCVSASRIVEYMLDDGEKSLAGNSLNLNLNELTKEMKNEYDVSKPIDILAIVKESA